jgi:NADPH:quinone reductase
MSVASETTRAVVVRSHGGPDVLALTDHPLPALGPRAVRVRVRAASVNFRDVHHRRYPQTEVDLPFVPGSDFAGDILEAGSEVKDLARGDRVFGALLQGAYAEQVVVDAGLLFPIPEGVGYDLAAALPVAGLSASFLLSTVALAEGSTVVTYAPAGGLGCFLGGLLATRGVRSIGLTSSAQKAAVARAAGHAEIVNYREVDPVQEVLDLTGGVGVEVVFDSVAGPEFARSFRMLRNEGVVVLCGRAAGEPDLGAAYGDFIGSRRNLALRDFLLNVSIFDHLSELPARMRHLLEAVRGGQVRVPITTFPLHEAARAHRMLEAGATVGKLVLNP